jgi:hypothetical protein
MGIWFAFVWPFGSPAIQGQQRVDFASEREFLQRLQQPVQIRWSRAPLRSTVERLSRTQGLAIFLDRRLDPQQPLELRVSTSSLGGALKQLAKSRGAGVSLLPPVVYLGPPSTTDKLATVWELNRQRVQRLDRSVRLRWQTAVATSWPSLSEPRQLVTDWTRQRGVILSGVERIPHDLWAAQQLPPLDLLHRLTIVLAGFDLSVSVDSAGRASVVRMPEQAALTRSYVLSDAQWARWPEWSDSLTGIDTQRTANRLTLTGRAEDHRQVAGWLQGAATVPTTVEGAKRYTLTVRNQPREQLLKTLASQLGLELQWKGVGEVDKSQLVSLKLQNATLDELLRAVVNDAGLSYRLVAKSLIVSRQESQGDPRPADGQH